jgi:hypothetical protein
VTYWRCTPEPGVAKPPDTVVHPTVNSTSPPAECLGSDSAFAARRTSRECSMSAVQTRPFGQSAELAEPDRVGDILHRSKGLEATVGATPSVRVTDHGAELLQS